MPPAKANIIPPTHSSLQPLKLKICLTINGKMSKQIFGIFILSKAYGTPYGWAFLKFYHLREFIKSMCNCNGNITTLGGEDFEPFINLTAKCRHRVKLCFEVSKEGCFQEQSPNSKKRVFKMGN